MNGEKLLTLCAILVLAFCIWVIGWALDTVITFPAWLRHFVNGLGILTTLGFIWTAYKELTD